MQTDHWARVKEVFDAALNQPQADRAAWLTRECGNDLEFRQEIETLIESAESAGILDEPLAAPDIAPAAELPALNGGRRLGPYSIVRELGRGGMGTVYLANRVDGEFEQAVALKVIRMSLADETAERRFRVERQVLASLEHPHIARLLDGGVSDSGEPFFVMEYVAGDPLSAFARGHQLGVGQRLAIFQKVCSAVSYAHGKLIVHRDLKPTNILVAADGEPKLIDFGLAKILDAADVPQHTLTSLRAFTPAYASPEQIHGELVTTASDVYSLGVVLYELLAGTPPFDFDGRTVAEMMRTIETVDAVRPSQMLERRAGSTGDGAAAAPGVPYPGHALEGDLDNIVLMALRKEPSRRYASVAALSDDVQRYIDQRPVLAHPSTVVYRAGKFLRRHTAAVIAATLAILAVVGGLGVSLWQADIARAERDRATRRFEDVRRLSNSLLFELSPRIERLPGATAARDLLVRRALEYLDSLATESADDEGLQIELAAAYEKVGDLQGNPINPNLIELDAAIGSYLKARRIREGLAGRAGETAAERLALAENFRVLGNIYSQANEFERAAQDLNRALVLYDQQATAAPGDTALQVAVAQVTQDLGRHQSNSGRYAGAIAPFERTIATAE
ncbi:MAG: serine/threonine-protein kinase, partial [Vicinamibacterales bacterium]